MSRKKHCINYAVLYPGVEITDEVLAALKESDRKMKYAEYDLKCERFIMDEEKGAAFFLPSREDSLERLMEENRQFRNDSALPEEVVIEALYKGSTPLYCSAERG